MSQRPPESVPWRWPRSVPLVAAALLLQGWPWLDRNKVTSPVYPALVVTSAWVAARTSPDHLQIVDARPPGAYAAGHLPGALSLEARKLPVEPAALGPLFARAGLVASRPIVVYSDQVDPAAADQLVWRLEVAGQAAVRLLNGGLDAWRAERRPLATGAAPPPHPARFDAAPDTARFADQRYVREHYGRRGTTVIDSRKRSAWEQGHIPHSLTLDATEYVGKDGLILAGPDLRAALNELGPRPGEPIDLRDELIVCADDAPGQIPVSPYLVARAAGVSRVRVFPGGYAEWRKHTDAPVVSIVSADVARHMLETSRRSGDPAVLLDLRGDNDYAAGHIPGARLLRPDQLESRFDSLIAAVWPKATPELTPIIVYCYGPTCTRSRNGTTFAARRGWRHLYWLRDGTLGWQQTGGEIRRSTEP